MGTTTPVTHSAARPARHDLHMSSSPSAAKVDARSVFLSAALGTDIEPAKAMLATHGFEPIQWTQLPAEGLVRGLPEMLDTCVALVAIIDKARVAPAVLLEVGAALGKRLPVVVMVTNAVAAESLPPVLRELAVLVAQDNRSVAGVRLAETLYALIEVGTPTVIPSSPAQPWLLPKEHLVESAFGSRIERDVADILLSKGARIVPTPRIQLSEDRYFTPDMAVWVEALPHPGLNPVLVEVAGTHWDGSDPVDIFRERVETLRSQLASHGCVLGLVITSEERPVTWHVNDRSAIASMGVNTLAQHDLVRLLSQGRNRWVHGYR